MAFLPVSASKKITAKYKKYLRTIFEIKQPIYQKQFDALLEHENQFANGPFLDVTDSFEKGKNIMQLIEEGVLPGGMRRLNINLTRPLYFHQEVAVRKVLSGKNVVVSTGTGSGKTESFLLPMLSEIIREQESGTLHPGVRALLIYPMNALANDQIERLRDLLADYPEITFGSYTGQTREKYKEALEEYRVLNDEQLPRENELISREQMKDTPPHILVTNYAMLEYLMVRPDDNVFFNEDLADKWKYIVLDEAHVYSGTTGIEVSMLLRRLKATLKNKRIKYILTSATLGDEKSNVKVAQFASKLCDSEFDAADVIRARRVNISVEHHERRLPIKFYCECADILSADSPDSSKLAMTIWKYVPDLVLSHEPKEMIFEAIYGDETFRNVKAYLRIPKKVSDISTHMGWSENDTEKFVITASSAAKNGVQLFDARYHMFLRATESVFVTLGPSKKLFFNRSREYQPPSGVAEKVFEIATCSFCHSIFLIGSIFDNKLEQDSRGSLDGSATAFLLAKEYENTDEDSIDATEAKLEGYELCPYCGFVRKADLVKKKSCEHGDTELIKIWKIGKRNEVKKCPSCETSSPMGILRMFFTGQEAVTSVIGTALFEELPSYKIHYENNMMDDDSGFSFDVTDRLAEKVKEAKQFIAFSDSRQAAAFYASYMDKTYKAIMYKRLIVDTIEKNRDLEGQPLNHMVENLISQFESYEVCSKNVSVKKEAWKAILSELVDNNGGTSLYKMGLLGIDINDGVKFPPNPKWKLTSDEVRTICREFLLSMMSSAAITQGIVGMTKEDLEDYTHGGILNSYTYSDSDAKKYQKAFVPTKVNLSNKRIEYIQKIAAAANLPSDKETCLSLLKGIWNHILTKPENAILKMEKGAYRVNAESLTIRSAGWYYCPKCKKITQNSVRNVCPTYHCDGVLEPVDVFKIFEGNHYFDLYNNMEIRPLRIVEHTAQLSKEKAFQYQKDFKKKELDVLSCSTTFEMGVDVGSLETVFMRNMPPAPSNYAQRAGRAGRSSASAAYALTFCNKSNHDFTFFNNPIDMIKGKILPPSFNINNEKIAVRHVYASAMSFFWKKHSEFFAKTKDMMGDAESCEAVGLEQFIQYIKSRPNDLKQFLLDFLSDALVKTLKIETFGWVEALIGEQPGNEGIFIKALRNYTEEVKILLQERDKCHKMMKSDGAVVYRLNTFYNEPIIAFLSRKGVFPRYGFPVDTVELNIPLFSGSSDVYGLQLQRDLSMAISEYAPGSEIVANDNLIRSRYLKKPANLLWKMYDYKMCKECGSLTVRTHTSAVGTDEFDETWVCNVCNTPLGEGKNTFIIPEFGFIADGNHIRKPGLVKPTRTYNNEISYVGHTEGAFDVLQIGEAEIGILQSTDDEMVVINSSNFFVCKTCGYTEVDSNNFRSFMRKEHKPANGHKNCACRDLQRYSLGYRFNTNVVQLRFIKPALRATDRNYAYTVLQGILRGFCSYFSIDERDVSGCLQYFYNEQTRKGAYGIVLYDNTPGGSGYVKMLNNANALKEVLMKTYVIMTSCGCGGEEGDSSCYSCLRNYYNQKHHDEMKRSYVIDFIEKLDIL